MAETVTLYTSSRIDDTQPTPMQYYLDWRGIDVLKTAMINLGSQYDPRYGLILKTNLETRWIDNDQTIRLQGLKNGDMIIVYPLPVTQETTQPQQQAVAEQQPSANVQESIQQTNATTRISSDQSGQQQPLIQEQVQQYQNSYQPPQQQNNQAQPKPLPIQDLPPLPDIPSLPPMPLLTYQTDMPSPLPDFQSSTQSNLFEMNFSQSMFDSTAFQSSDSSNLQSLNLQPLNLELSPISLGDNFNQLDAQSVQTLDSGFNKEKTNISTPNESEFNVTGVDMNVDFSTSVVDFSTTLPDYGAFQSSILKEKKKISPITLSSFLGYHCKNPLPVELDQCGDFKDIYDSLSKAFQTEPDMRYAIIIKTGNNYSTFLENTIFNEYSIGNTTEVYFVPRDQRIEYITSFSNKKKSALIDTMKPINTIFKQLAEKEGISNYNAFSLYVADSNHHQELIMKKPLLNQVFQPKIFIIKRRFFLFTGEDLETLKSAKQAYQEAVNMFINSPIDLPEEDAITFLILSVYAEAEKIESVNFSSVPDDLSYILPTTCKSYASTIGKKVRMLGPKFNGGQPIDRFNAIRKALGFLRHIKTFAAKKYRNVSVRVKYNHRKYFLDVTLILTPLSIRIYNAQNKILEEVLSYSSIIEMNYLGNEMEIKFALDDGKVTHYIFTTDDSKSIVKYIQSYIDYIRLVKVNRAKARALQYGDEIGRIDERDRITLHTASSMKDPNPMKCDYDLKFTGKIILKAAIKNLKLQEGGNYVALLKVDEKTFHWLPDDQPLSAASVTNGMYLYILQREPHIRITFSDGHTKLMTLDISRTIEELTPMIFQKNGEPPLQGYTLFSMQNPNELVPLDTRYTIPEQCSDYSQLTFKRRFYVISKEVLQNPISTFSTQVDCRNYLLSSQYIHLTLEQAINLAILDLYSSANSEEEVKLMKDFELSTRLPKSIKITPKVEQLFRETLNSTSPKSRFDAAKKYLGQVRLLNGFGVETFECVYTDLSFEAQEKGVKPIPNCVLGVGPLHIEVFSKTGQSIIKIPYRRLKDNNLIEKRMIIKYLNEKDEMSSIEIRVKKIAVVSMLIAFNETIMYDLQVNKRKFNTKKQEEETLRIHGGFVEANGIVRDAMIDFRFSLDLNKRENLPIIWLEIKRTAEDVIQNVLKQAPELRVDASKDYGILLFMLGQYYKWVKPKMPLGQRHPPRKTIMFLLDQNPLIKITHAAGQTIQIQLDVTKKIKNLSPEIAKAFRLPSYIGYTLYLIDNDHPGTPLDAQRTIPEQTRDYNHLWFQRRFFIVTKNDLDEKSLKRTYLEVKALVFSRSTIFTLDQFLELAYYSMQAEFFNIYNQDNLPTKPSDYSIFFPSTIKVKTRDFIPAIKRLFITTPISTSSLAMTRYIQYARSLPTFSSEKFECVLVEDKKEVQFETKLFFSSDHNVFTFLMKDKSMRLLIYLTVNYYHMIQ